MAENTKENLLKAPFIYYFSNPKVPELYCLAVPMYVDLSEHIKNYELPNWHTKAPSKDLTNPVWSLDVADWVEADENSQGAILAEAQAKIKELDEKGKQLDQATDKVDQAVKAMQQVQAQSSQQNVAMMKSFATQTQNTNKLLATMQQTLAMVVKAVQNSATPEVPKADAPAQPATTDKQENGGN